MFFRSFLPVFCLALFVSGAYSDPLISLRCAPVAAAGEMGKDPITTIWVNVAGREWRVMHVAMSGSQYERSQQYNLRDVSTGQELAWTGALVSRPFLTMTGRIRAFGETLSYEETIRDAHQNGALVADVRSNCVPVALPNTTASTTAPSVGGSMTPLKTSGGVLLASVQINGSITLDFIVDSGAADVSIPADVVLTLLRTGTLTKDDFLGDQQYVTADGRTVPSTTFRIRSLQVGDRVVNDVKASVAPVEGGLLLGQSFLRNFRTWSIDNDRQMLVLN